MTRTAACSCGQLSATVAGDPIRVSVCHCLACQRRSGSAFAEQARFPREAVEVQGNAKQYVRIGDSGGRGTFSFCPECGVTVYYEIDARPGEIIIPVGVFADPHFPPPTVSVYEERMHSWLVMPEGIERW